MFSRRTGRSTFSRWKIVRPNVFPFLLAAPRRLWDAALYELHKRLFAAVNALNAKWGKDALISLAPELTVAHTLPRLRSRRRRGVAATS